MTSFKEKKRLEYAADPEKKTTLKLFAKYFCHDFGPKALERILCEAGVHMDAAAACRTSTGKLIVDRAFNLKDGLEAVGGYRREIQKNARKR